MYISQVETAYKAKQVSEQNFDKYRTKAEQKLLFVQQTVANFVLAMKLIGEGGK
jgi:hypothetical protein